MKLIGLRDTKHPVSLRIYDTPGELRKIKEESVLFAAADLILIVLNADNDEHLAPGLVSVYNAYVASMLAKHCQCSTGMVAAPEGRNEETVTPLAVFRQKARIGGHRPQKSEADESLLTPLRYLGEKSPQQDLSKNQKG